MLNEHLTASLRFDCFLEETSIKKAGERDPLKSAVNVTREKIAAAFAHNVGVRARAKAKDVKTR